MIGFIGDIGCLNRFILCDLIFMLEVEYFICEFIYGDKDYMVVFLEIECFFEIIKEICVEKKGKLLIFVFSVGRIQEIVYMLD